MLDRRMAELEGKLIEEETALRVKQGIEKRVQEVMASDVVQQQLQQHLHTERQRLETQVPPVPPCHRVTDQLWTWTWL